MPGLYRHKRYQSQSARRKCSESRLFHTSAFTWLSLELSLPIHRLQVKCLPLLIYHLGFICRK